MTDFNIAETWKTMWEGALPDSKARELTRQSARSHWDSQQRILNSLEDFANGWFERRETGVRTATDAAQEMCVAPTFADMYSVWQSWASGAAERLAADGLAWQQCVALCSQHLAPLVTPAAQEAKRDAKPTKKSASHELPKAA